jgi:hypothetical protein
VTKRVRIVLIAAVLVAIAATIILLLTRDRHDSQSPSTPTPTTADLTDPTVVQFRETERICLTNFNNALARQRRNEIDELGLALAIDQEVLPAWQALRAKVAAATPSARNAALYKTLNAYLVARDLAWQAYMAGLRSNTDADARRHYDTYHAKNAEADSHAREVGAMFRAANP